MLTDSMSDFATQIRNASKARHKKVDVPASKMRVAVAEILKGSGFIRNFKLFRNENRGVLRLYLNYAEKGAPFLHGIERVSKPSRRMYVSYRDLSTVMNGIGIGIISTSKGMMSDVSAREHKLGGEYICRVW